MQNSTIAVIFGCDFCFLPFLGFNVISKQINVMSQLEKFILAEDNLKEVEERLKSFFIKNGAPVYEDSYINTTLDNALRFEHESKNHCGSVKLRASKIETTDTKKGPCLLLHFWDYDKSDNGGMYWFVIGSEFIFSDEEFYAKVPCRDYVVNKYDYIVKIFQARP